MTENNRRSVLEARFRSIDELIPYARNARTHSPEQVAQIAASILEFGWTNPVIADDAGVVAGHGRLLAARQLYDAGYTLKLPNGIPIPDGCAPVLDCSGWSEAQRRAYVLADNQLALNAGWDKELLKVELADLASVDFNLELIGFDDETLKELLEGTPQAPAGNDDNDEEGGGDAEHQCPNCGHRWSN